MPNEEEIDENNESGRTYSKKISEYFYNKINVENINEFSGESDFSQEDIENYEIETTGDGKIVLSTTKKLIRYLKILIDVNAQKLNSELDNRITSAINTNLSSINNSLNNKSNINHVHNTSDVISLDTSLNNKANNSDLNNHINNLSNPHEVSLEQLGFIDSGWDSITVTQSSIHADNFPYCRKYGKIVSMKFTATMYKKFLKNTTVCTLKSKYRPNTHIYSFAYNARTGASIPFTIDTSGNLQFNIDVENGTGIRIYECYLTS